MVQLENAAATCRLGVFWCVAACGWVSRCVPKVLSVVVFFEEREQNCVLLCMCEFGILAVHAMLSDSTCYIHCSPLCCLPFLFSSIWCLSRPCGSSFPASFSANLFVTMSSSVTIGPHFVCCCLLSRTGICSTFHFHASCASPNCLILSAFFLQLSTKNFVKWAVFKFCTLQCSWYWPHFGFWIFFYTAWLGEKCDMVWLIQFLMCYFWPDFFSWGYSVGFVWLSKMFRNFRECKEIEM